MNSTGFYFVEYFMVTFLSRVASKRSVNCLLLIHCPRVSSFFPENNGKLGAQEKGEKHFSVCTTREASSDWPLCLTFPASCAQGTDRPRKAVVLSGGVKHRIFASVFQTHRDVNKQNRRVIALKKLSRYRPGQALGVPGG